MSVRDSTEPQTASRPPSGQGTADRPTPEDLVGRARGLAPKIFDKAVDAERDRNVPLETVEEFIDAGLMRTLIPKRWGGYEYGFDTAFDIGIEIGRSTCGSSAWCLSYLADHAYLLALFPEEAQHDLWSRNLDVGIATSFAPTGKTTVVDGGYRLSGEWAWASGIRHSDWIIIGSMIFPENGHPDLLLLLVPKTDLKVKDVWHNAGLRASGSNTVLLDDVFVPAHRVVSMADLREGRSPGAAVNTAPIYSVPLIAASSYALLGPQIGVATGAYERWIAWNKNRVAKYTQAQVARQVTTQIRIAEVAAEIDTADLLVRRSLEVVRTKPSLAIADRVRNRRDFCYSSRVLVSAVDKLMQISGASGLFDTNPMQRAWRDVHTISCHVVMNFEAAAENFGRLELGQSLNEHDPLF